jgi:kanamycin kinase
VLDSGEDSDGAWLVTAAMPGESAVSARWAKRPAEAVKAIGEGLRSLHERAPVSSCPFGWGLELRLTEARRRIALGETTPDLWHAEHRHLGSAAAMELLWSAPPEDQLVVCHGDACAPNTLVGIDGRWAGLIDLGSLGVADRWADLAVATWSTTWNYGPEWEDALLDAYGIDPDVERIAFYRLLWDLT